MNIGAPAKALDGNPATSWALKLDPRTGGATNAGIVISLKPAEPVRSVSIATGSPGMTVELYGATGPLPASMTAPGWTHLASRPNIPPRTTIKVNPRSAPLDRVLIWITHAPPGVNAGALGISELSLAD